MDSGPLTAEQRLGVRGKGKIMNYSICCESHGHMSIQRAIAKLVRGYNRDVDAWNKTHVPEEQHFYLQVKELVGKPDSEWVDG